MKPLKVMTILGTRPEIIRLSRIGAKLDEHCDHVVVHTGQNFDYELNEVFYEEMAIRRPDHFLNAAGESAAATIGQIIARIDPVLEAERPHAVLILGDTNSALAAIAAKRRRIPIFHMEAGNRSFDPRTPEEINRRIVDHIADVNLTYSDIAREYLLREGLPPDKIIKTGSPMKEVLSFYKDGIERSDIMGRMELKSGAFFLVSIHREENVDAPGRLGLLASVLDNMADRYGLPIIVSTHPRTRRRIEALGMKFSDRVRLIKPLGFLDYVRLQTEASAVLSDSGTITEEASLLNFRALNLREAHERPEGMEEGAVIMAPFEWNAIANALSILENQPTRERRGLRVVADYDVDNVSEKVLRILHSYTPHVNNFVWRRSPILEDTDT